MNGLTLYFNPACSKCRRAVEILDAHDAEYVVRRYLEEAPTRDELERLVDLVGDARAILRSKDVPEADLASADADRILDWIVARPALLERPIAVRGDQAVVARPPELLEELLGAR